MIDRLLARHARDRHQIRERNERPVRRAHPQPEDRLDPPRLLGRDLQPHRDLVLRGAGVERRHVVAGERRAYGVDDVALGDALQRRLLVIDAQHEPRRGLLDARVHVDDVGRRGERPANRLRELLLSGVVGPVDLGDDRREHRRAGRDLDHLRRGAVPLRDPLDLRAHGERDLVRLAAARVLVDEVHLQVAELRQRAQVVLPNEAVEVDRRRGARVGLVIGHLRHGGEVLADLVQDARRVLERRAGRHVDDDLELRLVVEGQHLQHDELHRGERHAGEDQRPDHAGELPAFARAVAAAEERGHHALEEAREPRVRGLRVLRRGGVMPAEQLRREPGRDHERDGERDQHADRGVDRDRAHVRAHQPAHERHRQQRRDHGERREDGRPAHLVDRDRDQLGQRRPGCERAVAVDVLDHHDRVVDQDPDREDEREERHAVQREAPRPRREERCGEREEHGDADDHRFRAGRARARRARRPRASRR